jgi:F0F1-type ATP synthase delta subunit
MGWLILLVVLQSLVACVVAVVLMRMLDKELIWAALEKFESFKGAQALDKVIVRSSANLSAEVVSRFNALHQRRFADGAIVFEQDKALKGGVVIIAGNEIFDFSVSNRLRHFWS